NFPPHCRLIAAQRAAGEAEAGTLKPQLRPSALLPSFPAAALETLTQMTSSAVAMISIASRMARTSQPVTALPTIAPKAAAGSLPSGPSFASYLPNRHVTAQEAPLSLVVRF